MKREFVKLEKLRCFHCKHTWIQRNPDRPPLCCPNCKISSYKDGTGPRSIVAAKAAMKRLQTAGK